MEVKVDCNTAHCLNEAYEAICENCIDKRVQQAYDEGYKAGEEASNA